MPRATIKPISTIPIPTDLDLQTVSPDGLAWIERSSSKRVLHIFGPVCNLIDETGQIFSLTHPSIGNGPFSGVLDGPDFQQYLTSESPIAAGRENLQIGSLHVNYSEASQWNPTPNWAHIRANLKNTLSKLSFMEKLISENAPPQSLAELVLEMPKTYQGDNLSFARAKQGIQELFSGLQTQHVLAMRNGGDMLAGLGLGLTPAGDDFLVGSMLALWSSMPAATASNLCLDIAEIATPKTNSLSAAWLTASARGQAGEHWHHLLQGLSTNDPATTEHAVLAILPSGHTSGADSLGGFIGTLRALAGKT